jgi:hypothetical protein
MLWDFGADFDMAVAAYWDFTAAYHLATVTAMDDGDVFDGDDVVWQKPLFSVGVGSIIPLATLRMIHRYLLCFSH